MIKLLIRSTLLPLLLISALQAVSAQTATTTAAGQISEFDVNGLKVLVKRRTGTPTVAAGLYFRGGVKELTPENAGIEALTLNVAAEGTKTYPRARLRKETSSVGTVISSGSNNDFSALALGCTKQDFEHSWKIFTDIVVNPTFLPDDVERVRGTFLTGLKVRGDSPENLLELTSSSILFSGHPYATDPQGTVATISKFKSADLAAYHKKLIETSRMLLVIVGDLDPATVKTLVEASFGSLPRGNYVDKPVPALNFSKPTVDVSTKTLETNYLKGTFAAPSLRDPDYYAMRTAITVLQSNVFQEVRGRRNLAYAPDAELEDNAANTASVSSDADKPNEAIAVMLDEIRKIKAGSVDADEIARMGSYFLTTYYIKQETNAAQAAELAQYEMLGGGWRNSLDFLAKMRRVKPEEIRAAANKYMKNIRVVVVGNPADVDKAALLTALQ